MGAGPSLGTALAWTYSGVDITLGGNGGLECRDYLSLPTRLLETLVFSGLSIAMIAASYKKLTIPEPKAEYPVDTQGRRTLLLLTAFVFGIEVGFKLSTKQTIFLLNPCHVATAVQLYLLSGPPSRCMTAVFRLHMVLIVGAALATFFPVLNTLEQDGEVVIYFIQHTLIQVTPIYLMSIGGPYIPEDLWDYNWSMFSFGCLSLYHFLPLQVLGYLSLVNLNCMLCPAISDPFEGQYYRMIAMSYQVIVAPLYGKFLILIAKTFFGD